MKTTLMTIAMALGVICSLKAQQNISIGVRGGLTVPNLTGGSGGSPLSEGYSTRSTFGAGVFAEFKISPLFSIQPMIEYAQEGGQKNGMQAFLAPQGNASAPTYFYANFNNTAKINYLLLPVLAKFGWDLGHANHWRIYVDAGPYVGLLLNAHQVLTGGMQPVYMDKNGSQPIPNPADPSQPLQSSFDSTVNIKSNLHKANFGVEGNVGIAYKFNRSTVFVEGGSNYGLMNIQKNADDGQNHIGAVTVMVGYAYSLGRK